MKKIILSLVLFSVFILPVAQAEFPADFEGVVWLDTNVSSWPETAVLTMQVTPTAVILNNSKTNEWPITPNALVGSCCNANAWVFAQFDGTWYAVTWEWIRKGQTAKNRSAFEGNHTRVPPFCCNGQPAWQPKNGEVYGLMVSGMARLNRFGPTPVFPERSNVVLWRWGEGPVELCDAFPENPACKSAAPPLTPVMDLLFEEESPEAP